MELRQLTTDNDRRIFGDCLTKARATRGNGFRPKERSRLEMSHLMFGRVYGLFENHGEPIEEMAGGFIVHDLATLPQSFPKPDVSHLPPMSVIEAGDLWSLSTGVTQIAAGAVAAIAGMLQVKAIIVYPLVDPVDRTALYAHFKFDKACERMRVPYGETLQGAELWIQPMILQNEAVEAYIRWGFDFLFRTETDRLTLRFDRPASSRPKTPETRTPNPDGAPPDVHPNQSAESPKERNGSAAAPA
ncbi:MAG: hypothetical protein ACREQR_02480 [Candidatus Binataceae bacterium]